MDRYSDMFARPPAFNEGVSVISNCDSDTYVGQAEFEPAGTLHVLTG
jgi:hypothetical protein